MHRFVARENIDHYLGILNSDVLLAPEKREAITKLLIAELDKSSHDPEQLEFAETRAAKGRERLKHVRALRNAAERKDRANAELLVVNVEAIQDLLETFCHQLRASVNKPLIAAIVA